MHACRRNGRGDTGLRPLRLDVTIRLGRSVMAGFDFYFDITL
jgi:hypothetical protein